MSPRTRWLIFVTVTLFVTAGWKYSDYRQSFSARLKFQVLRCPQMPCLVSMAKTFPESWDRVLIFETSASQEDMDKLAGTHVPKPDLQRTIVFMTGKKIQRIVHETVGIEAPLSGEVIFGDIADHPWLELSRNTVFVHAKGDGPNGSYHILTLLRPGTIPI